MEVSDNSKKNNRIFDDIFGTEKVLRLNGDAKVVQWSWVMAFSGRDMNRVTTEDFKEFLIQRIDGIENNVIKHFSELREKIRAA